MTTYVSAGWTFNISTDSDAAFVGWVQETDATIIGSGLIAVPQTGELDLNNIGTRPTQNTNKGWRMYRFDDSLQGTYPLYVKVFYGVGNGGFSRGYRLQVQVGSAVNGSGTFTGQASTIASTGGDRVDNPATATMTNYACHTEGFFGLFMGVNGAAVGPLVSFSVSRTRNDVGNFDGLGAYIWADASNPIAAVGAMNFVRILNNQYASANSTHFCIAPGVPGDTSLLNGDKQLYPHFYPNPAVQQCWSQFTVRGSEFITTPTTFLAAPHAGITRTYLFLGTSRAPWGEASSNSNFRIAFLWE